MGDENRYFTKSEFVLGLDCPTKLYYSRRDDYVNKKEENEFLAALAQGGLQVGELAKLYYPGGIEIDAYHTDEALQQTFFHIQKEEVTLFEPTFTYKDFLIRADILVKNGTDIRLIEVKSKSYEPEDTFFTRNGYLRSNWQPYLYDVAFQYWVLNQAFPAWNISPFLMLADKSKEATVEGLHQNFRVVESTDAGYVVKVREELTREDIGERLLTEVDAGEPVQKIINGDEIKEEDKTELQSKGFEQWVETMADYYVRDEKYPVRIGQKCKDCPFYVKPSKLNKDQLSGFVECWSQALDWSTDEFREPHIFDLWNYRDVEERLEEEVFHLADMPEELYPASRESVLNETDKWSNEQRQTIQIMSAKGDIDSEIILEGLKEEIESWTFPLHFIDFEVHVGSALPFYKGMSPYEPVAFQFSEHRMYKDYSVKHFKEWLLTNPNRFPNFDFVRALKNTLTDDGGTVFMYSSFENTILNRIADQIRDANKKVIDSEILIEWIDKVTRGGNRAMVDLLELTKQYHFHPAMNGSLSLKNVLPAILKTSQYLGNKYSKPYYGKNFDGMIWHQVDEDGYLRDPYDLLPPMGRDLPHYKNADEAINQGSAAMLAYARLQFDDLEEEDRVTINNALRQYCELDTLAMVMLVEHWLKEWSFIEE